MSMKNNYLTTILLSILIIIVSCLSLTACGNEPSLENKIIEMIEEDLGETIDIKSIYYNEEEQGCIVEFYKSNIMDTACVYLNDEKVGYESVYNQYQSLVDNATTNEDKQNYATQILDYPYDVLWIYNLDINGANSDSGWKKIK